MKLFVRAASVAIMALAPLVLGASNDGDPPKEKSQARPAAEKVRSDQQAKEKGSAAAAAKPAPLLYKPPLRGAPAGRVGGGTRGVSERESFSLSVLVPDHAGLTVSDQPRLYWYISKPTTHPVELTVIERNAVSPLLEQVVPGPGREGIQAIRLADYGVHLRRGVQYRWFVTLVTDQDQRSKDILAGGIITLVAASPELQEKLKRADGSETPAVFAEAGIWYDALSSLTGLIESAPGSAAGLIQERASLLSQVGLAEPAEFERKSLPEPLR